ncbi:MAG TPA: right-handed parallel beta-helix repeat-containing protein, partial [bacterium]|nr:right-handed parallel beta-helix repeat-containing protein [bacterium]
INMGARVSGGAILDGFTISGVYCGDAALFNCTITGRRGDGVSCRGTAALTNCRITANAGSGVSCSSSSLTLTNCTIAGNTQAGVSCSDSSLTLTNCILWNSGDEIRGASGSSIMATFSCIQGGWPGEGNINSPPRFMDSTNGDYHLQNGSPCIDKGLVSAAPDMDMEAVERPGDDCLVDMGAYESPPEYEPGGELISPRHLYVRSNAIPGGDGSSWEKACTSISAAIRMMWASGEIWVAGGTYRESVCMEPGIALYGGFAGTEEEVSERNWTTNVTVIDATERSVAVFCADDTILAGFTVTGALSGIDCNLCSPIVADCTITVNGKNGVSCSSSSAMLTNCTIIENGGTGIYCGSSSPTLTDCTISENRGSGIFCGDSSPTLTKCTITRNAITAIDIMDGGGVYCYLSCPTLTDCTIMDNGESGILCRDSSPTLTSCTITGNAHDGVSCLSSSLTLTNCTITGNSSDGVYYYLGGSPAMTNCTISENAGYGVYCDYGSSPAMTNCTISENAGIGVVCYRGCSPILNNCTISGNGNRGIACQNDSSPALNNCAIIGNTGEQGGGIYCYDRSSLTLSNCSFSGNSARDGNALACYSRSSSRPSILKIINCILWDGGNEIWNNNSTITISYSNIQGSYPGEGNIDADPLFIQPWDGESADLHLTSGSPCIDAGNPDPSYNDACRPPGLGTERCDMGAYGGAENSGWPEESEPPVGVSEWALY